MREESNKKRISIKIIVILVLIVILIITIVHCVNKIKDTKMEIESSISEEYIPDETIKQGIIKERERIKKEEYSKIIKADAPIVIADIIGIVVVCVIKKKAK